MPTPIGSSWVEVIGELLTDQCRTRIVTEALEQLSTAADQTQKSVRYGLTQIPVAGYRDASRAPRLFQVSALAPLLGKVRLPTRELLQLWSKAEPVLVDAVRSFLASSGADSGSTSGSMGRSVDEVRARVHAFVAQHPGTDPDEAGVMMAWIAWRAEREAHEPRQSPAPIDDPGAEVRVLAGERESGMPGGSERFRSARLAVWAVELAQCPPGASEWDELPSFVEYVQVLMRRRDERRGAQEADLTGKLAALRADYGSILDYLGQQRTASWAVPGVRVERYDELDAALGGLRESLDEFQGTQTIPVGSFAEDLERTSRLRTLAERVSSACDHLEVLVRDSPGRAVGGPGGAALSPTVGGHPPAEPDVDCGESTEAVGERQGSSPAGGQGTEPPQSATRSGEQAAALSPVDALLRLRPPSPRTQEGGRAHAVIPVEAPPPTGARAGLTSPWERRLTKLTDAEIAQSLDEAKENPLATRALLAEQQLRWLIRGQNLRGYVAARFLEEPRRSVPGEEERQHVPSWLCWLALMVSDPWASRLDFELADLITSLFELGREPDAHQRFFVAWMCTGLLGKGALRCIQVIQNLPGDVFEAPWLGSSPFLQFCAGHLLEPARHGRRIQLSAQESAQALQRRLEEEVRQASEIVARAINYRNRYVVRYWVQLVGPGGPVRALLAEAQKGPVPTSLPTAQQLAAGVPGWPQIQAAYRNNILQRLATFLDHLRDAATLQGEIASQAGAAPSVLRPDEVKDAIRASAALLGRLRDERCPSVGGYRTVAQRLTELMPEEGLS